MAGTPFNLPGGMLIQLLAGTGIVWLLSQATSEEWKIEAYVLAAAIAYYLLKAFLRKPSVVSASPPVPDR
jgi:hypothetical protein